MLALVCARVSTRKGIILLNNKTTLINPLTSLITTRFCTTMTSTDSATPANVAASSAKKAKAPITDTALHIIKGAVVKVLNTPLTLTTEAKSATKGRLTVEYSNPDKPTDAQIAEIQDLTNEKIVQNVPVETLKVDRKQAEEQYRKNPVNNTYIYDNFKVPDSVTELTLVHIKDWNVNCCPSEHLKTTGEVGGIKISGVNHRANKKELEIVFDILPAPPGSSSSSSSSASSSSAKPTKAAASKAAAPLTKGPAPDDVAFVTEQILALLANPKEDKVNAARKVESLLVSLKNTAYSNGMQAAKSK